LLRYIGRPFSPSRPFLEIQAAHLGYFLLVSYVSSLEAFPKAFDHRIESSFVYIFWFRISDTILFSDTLDRI